MLRRVLPFVGRGVPGGGTYATWNPSDKNANITLSNANLTATQTSGGGAVRATKFISTGEHKYWEVLIDNLVAGMRIGMAISGHNLLLAVGDTGSSIGYDPSTGRYLVNGSNTGSVIATATTGDRIGLAYNRAATSLTIYKNGVAQTAYPSVTDGDYFPAASGGSSGNVVTATFGPTMTYSIPSGASLITYP